MQQIILELEEDAGCSKLLGKRTGNKKEIVLSAGGWRAQPCTPYTVTASKEENNRTSKFLPLLLLPS